MKDEQHGTYQTNRGTKCTHIVKQIKTNLHKSERIHCNMS